MGGLLCAQTWSARRDRAVQGHLYQRTAPSRAGYRSFVGRAAKTMVKAPRTPPTTRPCSLASCQRRSLPAAPAKPTEATDATISDARVAIQPRRKLVPAVHQPHGSTLKAREPILPRAVTLHQTCGWRLVNTKAGNAKRFGQQRNCAIPSYAPPP